LFFQLLLLGGYAYAHASTRWLRPRRQVLLHLGVLVAALALLPIIPSDGWKPRGGGNPTLQILLLLAATVGVPYFVLSSTGPLLQQWFTRTHPGVSPYRLFALSNAGSLLALISYPIFFETHFTRKIQATMWSAGLVLYVLSCSLCALKLWKPNNETQESQLEPPSSSPAIRNTQYETRSTDHASRIRLPVFWLLLPACASILLLAVTNKLCQDVAVVPFLWVLPLALYLLSFVICFDSPRWYLRFPFTLALIAALAAITWAMFHGADWPLWKQVSIYTGGLFICCMVCHGELYRLRPEASRLTGFYLMIATGGAVGGVFVAVVAPLLFSNYYELDCGLFLCALLFFVVLVLPRAKTAPAPSGEPLSADPSITNEPPPDPSPRPSPLPKGRGSSQAGLATIPDVLVSPAEEPQSPGDRRGSPLSPSEGERAGVRGRVGIRVRLKALFAPRVLAWVFLGPGLVVLAVVLVRHTKNASVDSIFTSRNFYGVLTVLDYRRTEPKDHYRLLEHGRITHGLQFVDPEEAKWPTTYYGEQSGVGLALGALPAGHRRVGLVGLGTGTLTAYARPGDYFRIYEINPEVKRLASSNFTYLSHCQGEAVVMLGDARLSLERDAPQQFDLLALDAFSSDAIPVHLLTKEAFELYQHHLKTNAVIAVHISNHFLDLQPVVLNLARNFNYQAAIIDYDDSDGDWWLYSSTWILLTRNAELLRAPAICDVATAPGTNAVQVPLWTDDFTSLFQILK
jgi:hypothetical protein